MGKYYEAWKKASREDLDSMSDPKISEKERTRLFEKQQELYKKALDESFDERDRERKEWAEEHRATIEDLLEALRKEISEGIDKVVINIRGITDSYGEWTEIKMTYEVYEPKEKNPKKYLAGLEIIKTYQEPYDC